MNWGLDLPIDEFLALKPGGSFKITYRKDEILVTIDRPGEPSEYFRCGSPGQANQLGIYLTDAGLTGYVEGAL